MITNFIYMIMKYIIYIRQEDITMEAQSQTQTFCPIVRCAPPMFTYTV